VIVIVGVPAWQEEPVPAPDGRACSIAIAAARSGARVELVGRIGDDPVGDGLVLALAAAGVGHVAVLRDPGRPTPVVAASVADDDADPTALLVADREVPRAMPDGPRLEPADVSLGLEYLTAFDVLVVTDEVPAAVLPVAIEAAAFATASVIVLLAPGSPLPTLPDDAVVLEAPSVDEGPFAELVARVAVELDAGRSARDALGGAVRAGWEPTAR
jgi:ribokinase